MDNPRAVQSSELPSLSRLVDTVFRGRADGWMFGQFPCLFSEANCENVFVFVDGDEVVSHVGMVQRQATLGGCLVQVGCIGAVATYEAYRGKGLATQLLETACAKAAGDGVDFLLISGDRGLYRRVGAADVGQDGKVLMDQDAVRQLRDLHIGIREVQESDLPECAQAYRGKMARFIRPLDDWLWYLQSFAYRRDGNRFVVVLRDGVVCGYVVSAQPNKEGRAHVIEFAGDETAVAAALAEVMERDSIATLELRLQAFNSVLKSRTQAAGVALTPIPASGTLLLINFPQLMTRLRPWFVETVGLAAAESLRFRQQDDQFFFSDGSRELVYDGKMAAAQHVFGDPNQKAHPGPMPFPVPSLTYGLNYV